MMGKPILAVAFDGVIFARQPGGDTLDFSAPAVTGAAEWLVGALRHYHVVIVSHRLHYSAARDLMVEWLTEVLRHDGFGYIRVRDAFEFSALFVPCAVLISSNAIRFDGAFPEVATLSAAARPWIDRVAGGAP